jgi:hypothetical protein
MYIYSTIWYDPKYCLMIHIYFPVNPRESRSSLITSWNDRGFWIEHCSVVRPMTHFLAMFFFLWKGDDSVNVWSVYQNTHHAIFFHVRNSVCGDVVLPWTLHVMGQWPTSNWSESKLGNVGGTKNPPGAEGPSVSVLACRKSARIF